MMARVARIGVRLPGSDRWVANLGSDGMKYRYRDGNDLKWITLTPANTRVAKNENGQLIWIPVL